MTDVYTDAYISGMKEQKNFRFEIDNVSHWQKVAEMDNRNLTNLIETVMNRHCETVLPKKSITKKPKSKKAQPPQPTVKK